MLNFCAIATLVWSDDTAHAKIYSSNCNEAAKYQSASMKEYGQA